MKLSKEEFNQVTEAFLNRLEQDLDTAGCNDLFEDEFPESVCSNFCTDLDVFEVWKEMLIKSCENIKSWDKDENIRHRSH